MGLSGIPKPHGINRQLIFINQWFILMGMRAKKKFEALINRASEAAGDQRQLAAKLDISMQAIDKWKATGVPAERVLQIERVTERRITRHELRPDLYPRDGL